MADPTLTLAEAAELVSGVLSAEDEGFTISGVQTLEKAQRSQASFLSNVKYKSALATTRAGLVLLSHDAQVPDHAEFAVIRLQNPYIGFALLQRFFSPQSLSNGIIHPTAAIDTSAKIAPGAQIDAHVCIGKHVIVGKGCIIGAGTVLADGAQLGEDCLIHPRVVIEHGVSLGNRVIVQAGAIIGSDGFGFAWTGREFLKIPQVGSVMIEDDVEIGANSCIDRGAIDDTMIGRGVKIDNLVQIGHNVIVGELSVMAGQVGISGSTTIGKGCQFGGQSGAAGHLHIADGVVVSAKAGVIGDIKVAGMVSGFPAVPHRKWLRSAGIFDRLPEIWKKIRDLS